MSVNRKSQPWIEVAIGLLIKGDKVCLSLRQSHQHLAGHWEFPGGKIEQDESPQQALSREFKEELGVTTSAWQPLITIPWHYEKVSVRLHVYQTDQFVEEPTGLEGQTVEWCSISELPDKHFPEANRGILQALNLPDLYMSIGSYHDETDCLMRLQQSLNKGVRLIQFKSKGLSSETFVQLGNQLADVAKQSHAKLILNGAPKLLDLVPNAAGIQLSSNQVASYSTRPIALDKLLAVSTHSMQQVEQALSIGADIILISPVNATSAHADMEPVGWKTFTEMLDKIPVPVYALGGMKLTHLKDAKSCGAQGIMLTAGLWPDL